ncbi:MULTISPECIES: methanogenesis marker 15 protein [Methanosarcina]|uniref:Putative methanogenesis marker protein 15 n=1 Tax=Methanosarcina vacuolata Z-761 TaxID=1434123 RepID=A0A0E3Q7E3_9EURY|nr:MULTISPECIES: methanogenesis marker 15 protein [Methanosarcina]AKB45545.1 putative methanogenesis marker protein 15 [Methanosarcina vacuolata Z-761]AKB49015.1 putative methanogenesis marker protein 15 [Methanosarcina sp. Kolksee]
MSTEESALVKIALVSCGSEYAGVQPEFEEAAAKVNAKFIFPEIDVASIDTIGRDFGLEVASGDLRLMMARAKAVVEGIANADGVFITTCFRCAEGAIVRNEVRRYIHEHSKIPVISYSFTESTSAGTLLTRLEALTTIVRRRHLLTREVQTGLTAGIDSGSTTTKAVVMRDNKIIGKGWVPTTKVLESAEEAYSIALKEAGVSREEVQALGTTGYGRFLIGAHFKAQLIQEEITVNSKGAVYLADKQKGNATVIDIGGMDNKAISVQDGIPGMFTMGGICAGASGRFFEMISKRLGVDITELGALAVKGMHEHVSMNSYCIVFGTQSLVNSLARGATPEDVAAAACYSVVEQIYEQQLQEVDVKEPLILVGGSSLIAGVPKALGELLKIDVLVPENSHLIGAVGAALLASGFVEE